MLALLAAPAARALPPLEQLEARVGLSPAAQLAERAWEFSRDALGAGRLGLGVSAFGNLGYAHNHDVIDPLHSWTYSQGVVGAGLSIPVFGSRLQLEDSLAEQQVQLAQLDARRQLARRELIARLRKAYADYWLAQRATLLAQEYLKDGPALEHVLELRTRSGLLLDADRLELLSGFSLARRDEASGGAEREVALAVMRELTGADLDGGVAVRPLVPMGCLRSQDPGDEWMDADPELTGLQKIVALRAVNPRDSALYPVQSSVQLGYQSRDDMPTGQRGGSAVLNWSFQVPLEYGSQRHLLARAAAAQLSRARLEYELRRDELRAQRRELIARAAVLERNADFAATRLAAADAALDERALRHARLEGDTTEQLQKARLDHYHAARSLIDADKAVVYWYADWARFGTSACETPPSARSPPRAEGRPLAVRLDPIPAAAQARPGDRALYLWRSGEWLAHAAEGGGAAKLAALHSAGITRLLVSFDAGQMRAVTADPAALVQAVRGTHGQGLRVELLLADPLWIQPGQRPALLGIIIALKTVPFDGLHLDVEPEQLDAAPGKLPELLGALSQTLAAASAASPWPLALSLHPRDLEVEVGDGSFAQTLERLRVSPTLMVYVADPERAVAIAEPLLGHYPGLSFSVALSLEKSLGPQESLWSYPEPERRRRIEQVESGLAAANFTGLTLELEDAWGEASGLARLAAGE
jgi:outer membrane protein TolC